MSVQNMPSNVINVEKKSRPNTEPLFKVMVAGEHVARFTSHTAWHSFANAYGLKKKGLNVDVYTWDPFVGRSVPVADANGYDRTNEYGEVRGDWVSVVEGRARRQAEKRGKAPSQNGVAIDEETARMMNAFSTILKSSSGALIKGKLTNKDMFVLREMCDLMSKQLDGKINDEDPDLDSVEPVTL
jgi:hypothetical protein